MITLASDTLLVPVHSVDDSDMTTEALFLVVMIRFTERILVTRFGTVLQTCYFFVVDTVAAKFSPKEFSMYHEASIHLLGRWRVGCRRVQELALAHVDNVHEVVGFLRHTSRQSNLEELTIDVSAWAVHPVIEISNSHKFASFPFLICNDTDDDYSFW